MSLISFSIILPQDQWMGLLRSRRFFKYHNWQNWLKSRQQTDKSLLPSDLYVAWVIQLLVVSCPLQVRNQLSAAIGRSGHYKSPSTIKRNTWRLFNHSHKMIRILKFNEEGLIDPSSNTIFYSGPDSGNLDNDWFILWTLPISLALIFLCADLNFFMM